MNEYGIQGIGMVHASRVGSEIMVSVTDILNAFESYQQTRPTAHRSPASINAKIRIGRTVHHMVDIPGACMIISQMRGKSREQQYKAVASLIRFSHENSADDIAELREPSIINGIRSNDAHPRPVGRTVKETIRMLGLVDKVSYGYMGKFVSDNYQGQSVRHKDGIFYEDIDQLTRLVSQRAKQLMNAVR